MNNFINSFDWIYCYFSFDYKKYLFFKSGPLWPFNITVGKAIYNKEIYNIWLLALYHIFPCSKRAHCGLYWWPKFNVVVRLYSIACYLQYENKYMVCMAIYMFGYSALNWCSSCVLSGVTWNTPVDFLEITVVPALFGWCCEAPWQVFPIQCSAIICSIC